MKLHDIDSTFAIVAVRCNSDTSVGKRKLVTGKTYYLLEGYNVEENGEAYTIYPVQRKNLNVLYDDYLNDGRLKHPHIQISAIVGQNGSGKSSLIEFIMRLINNLAAFTFGENKSNTISDRLHFINGVYGDLWYIMDGQLYKLEVNGPKISLRIIVQRNSRNKYNNSANYVFSREANSKRVSKDIINGLNESELKRIYNHFFYTIVSNHSLYAYNANDFISEWDDTDKETTVLQYYHNDNIPNKEFNNETRCWLSGLFHKNDGYQTPLVISPYREEGIININTEIELAKERLITLFIRNKNFRMINNHLVANGLSFTIDKNKDYGLVTLKKKFKMNNLTTIGYRKLRDLIVEIWGSKIGIDLTEFSYKPLYDLAIDYLVYKTIKIAFTYKQHNGYFAELSKMEDDCDRLLLAQVIESQSKDFSHITRKVFQTIAYLVYKFFAPPVPASIMTKENFTGYSPLDGLNELYLKYRMDTYVNSASIESALKSQALVPPPFFNAVINLNEIGNTKKEIEFETLSSGEKQQIFAISSMLYHLDNLSSVFNDKSANERIMYRNILLICEEVELYFHPELQQGFIKYLLDGICKLELKSISSIHIVLVTHSPYVLSDIPHQNVLALKSNGMPSERKLSTFCGNIHEMLKDSFFLSNGSQGAFAQWEVGHIMACIEIHKMYRLAVLNNQANNNGISTKWTEFVSMLEKNQEEYRFSHRYIYHDEKRNSQGFNYEMFCCDFSEDNLRQRINIIDEPLVRNIILQELDGVFAKSEEELRQAKINFLEYEIKRLKGEV
ncbi:MAG: AAA family ATPase [Muribaculum sp.]|nr:AAA family ATPase [Muribaculum sp.]